LLCWRLFLNHALISIWPLRLQVGHSLKSPFFKD
jgi:hypothetical protein